MCWYRNYGISIPVCVAASVPVCSHLVFIFLCLYLYISFIFTRVYRFEACAKANGITHAPIQLLHGDFLENNNIKNAISSAALVFMNNPKFGPQLNFKVLGERVCVFVCMLLIYMQLSFVLSCRKAVSWSASIGRGLTAGRICCQF